MSPIDVAEIGELPAPLWFIQFFKVLGFILHSVPMHLWLIGLPTALLLLLIGGVNAKTFARRILHQLPFVMAFGINLGIVPLLFIQAGYYKAFYPSTILMAWHWFGILLLVLPAYYLLYLTSGLVDQGRKWWPFLTGTTASLLFVGVGLIFASAWTLMSSPESWPDLWRNHSLGAASLGTASFWRNPVVYVRFLSIVGLAFLTVTFWSLFDAWFLFGVPKGRKGKRNNSSQEAAYSFTQPAKPSRPAITDFMDNPNLSAKQKKKLRRLRDSGRLSEEEELRALDYGFDDAPAETAPVKEKKARPMAEDVSDADSYRRWVLRFASALVWFGVFIGGGALWFYLYKILTPETPGVEFLFKTGLKSLPILLFTSIGLFTITLMIGRIGKLGGKLLVLLLGLFEVMTLTFFAVTRQLIQNGQLSGYLNLKAIPTNLQASPLIAFLITFVFGLGMILWMIHAMAKTAKK